MWIFFHCPKGGKENIEATLEARRPAIVVYLVTSVLRGSMDQHIIFDMGGFPYTDLLFFETVSTAGAVF